MNSIGEVVKKWSGQTKKTISVSQRLNTLLQNPVIRRFASEHPEVPRESYRRSIGHLNQLVMEAENCQRCSGLSTCPNIFRGHASTLTNYAGYLDLMLTPCSKLESHREETKQDKLIRSHHIPKDILEASFGSIDTSFDRVDVMEVVIEFCNRFATKDRPTTGLYLWGPLGAGKSRIAGAIVNELVQYNVDSFMFYVPEFMREVTESIHDRSLHHKLHQLKKVTLLILDDIGAEFLTPWKRDEILGAILQYRVAEQLPTIFTSNMDLDELELHLATNKDSDDMKAKRIMERIRHYTRACRVAGKNWREKTKKDCISKIGMV